MDDEPYPQRIMQPSLYALPKEMIELLLDSTAVIERVRHDLAGEVLITKPEKQEDGSILLTQSWEPIGERSMNDRGIRAIIKILNLYVNPDTMMTQLTDEEIYKIMLDLHYDLNALFYSRGKEFEINNNMKSVLINGVCTIVFAALKKSLGGKQLESLLRNFNIEEQRFPDMKKAGLRNIIPDMLSPFKRDKQ